MTTLNTVTTTTLAAIQLSQVIEQLKQDDSSLLQAYSEYAADNNYDSVFNNDYESINIMCTDSYDAIRAAFYGDYNPSHAYFTFNGYGNLQSFEYLDSEHCPIDIEKLAQWIVDNELFNDYDIEVTTLDDMLASIEDNITDDENMLNKLSDYLHVLRALPTKYKIGGIMDLLGYYEYNQLNDVITHLNINYE